MNKFWSCIYYSSFVPFEIFNSIFLLTLKGSIKNISQNFNKQPIRIHHEKWWKKECLVLNVLRSEGALICESHPTWNLYSNEWHHEDFFPQAQTYGKCLHHIVRIPKEPYNFQDLEEKIFCKSPHQCKFFFWRVWTEFPKMNWIEKCQLQALNCFLGNHTLCKPQARVVKFLKLD